MVLCYEPRHSVLRSCMVLPAPAAAAVPLLPQGSPRRAMSGQRHRHRQRVSPRRAMSGQRHRQSHRARESESESESI
eukprot:562106-Rhodomonas_salina.1